MLSTKDKIIKTTLAITNTAKLIEELKYEVRLLSGKIPKLTVDGQFKKAETVADRLLELIHELRILEHKLNFNKDQLFALYHEPDAPPMDVEDAMDKLNAEDSVLYD